MAKECLQQNHPQILRRIKLSRVSSWLPVTHAEHFYMLCIYICKFRTWSSRCCGLKGSSRWKEDVWVQCLMDVCCHQHWALGNSYIYFTLSQMQLQAGDMEVRKSRSWWAGYRKGKNQSILVVSLALKGWAIPLALRKFILAEVAISLPLENVVLWTDCVFALFVVVST